MNRRPLAPQASTLNQLRYSPISVRNLPSAPEAVKAEGYACPDSHNEVRESVPDFGRVVVMRGSAAHCGLRMGPSLNRPTASDSFCSMKLGLGLRLFLLTLLSSVLLPLALPNEFVAGAIRFLGLKPDESFYWGNSLLGLICIAPAFYAICASPTFKIASRLGVVFGGVSTALSNFWLMFFQGFSVWTYGGTILGYIGVTAVLFPFLRGLSRLSPRFRPFILAVGWTV